MIPLYLRTAFRALRKQPGYSAIHVIGLALGLACTVLIVSYVRFESSFDAFHAKSDRIARAYTRMTLGAEPRYREHTAAPFGDFLTSTFPEVEAVSRLLPTIGESFVRHGERASYVKRIGLADPAFFRMFETPAAGSKRRPWGRNAGRGVETPAVGSKRRPRGRNAGRGWDPRHPPKVSVLKQEHIITTINVNGNNILPSRLTDDRIPRRSGSRSVRRRLNRPTRGRRDSHARRDRIRIGRTHRGAGCEDVA